MVEQRPRGPRLHVRLPENPCGDGKAKHAATHHARVRAYDLIHSIALHFLCFQL